MYEKTEEQKEFLENIERWQDLRDTDSMALMWIEGVRIQGGHVCLELVANDGGNAEYAISIDYLVKKHGEFIKYSHPLDAEEFKAEIISVLTKAISEIEKQTAMDE